MSSADLSVEIRDVWAHNLESEFALIRDVIDHFPFVSMDTEFPGVPLRTIPPFSNPSDNLYHTLRTNVDLLQLIQLGLTLSDSLGNHPTSPPSLRPIVWQFNFREFDPDTSIAHPDSVALLIDSGVDLHKHKLLGIDSARFAELMMSSGIVLNDSIHWVTFHCAYDFAYLLKVLTGRRMPETREGFVEIVRVFFPVLYDVKHLMRFCNGLHGGLSRVAEILGVERVGVCHQAGSDSWVTDRVFGKMLELFDGSVEKYAGVMYGLEDVENGVI